MSDHPKKDDPIGDYVEWTEHRYDPGYYTGGRIPPGIRGLAFSARDQRILGVLIFVAVVVLLLRAWYAPGPGLTASRVGPLAVAVVLAAVAALQFRWARQRADTERAAAKHRHATRDGR